MNWVIVAVVGIGTYLTRLSFIGIFGNRRLPDVVREGLRFIAPAVLAALILPAVVRPDGPIDLTLANPRWLAAAVAGLVTWRTKNIALTAVAGLFALWLIDAIV